MSAEEVQALKDRIQTLEAEIQQLKAENDAASKKGKAVPPIDVNVVFNGLTRTIRISRDDLFSSVQATVRTAFNLATLPDLLYNGVMLTEETYNTGVLFEPTSTRKLTASIFSPFNVSGDEEKGIDYDMLAKKFGLQMIDSTIIQRLEAVTQKPAHPWLRRKFFFAHRGFDIILDHLEHGHVIYLYTGRGPSSDSLHLGHMIQFTFAKYLQDAFRCPLIIQLSSDEKFIFKKALTLDVVERMTFENTKDIMACGFDPKLTFIFSDLDYIGQMYKPVLRLLKHTTAHEHNRVYGFDMQSPAGFFTWPCIQAAPGFSCAFPFLFGPPARNPITGEMEGPTVPYNAEKKEEAPAEGSSSSKKNKKAKKAQKSEDEDPTLEENRRFAVPCLIPCAIDQDPYFRQSRDHANQLGCPPPCTLLSKFVPALTGGATKMSASASLPASAGAAPASSTPTTIFMNSSKKQIEKAVSSMFSIGQATKADQKEKGALIKDLSRDAAYQYLLIFDLETPDEELAELGQKYLNGTPDEEDDTKLVLSGTLKKRLSAVLWKMAQEHQERRAAITDEQVYAMMRPHPLAIKSIQQAIKDEQQ